MNLLAKKIQTELRAQASPQYAATLQRFFKTQPGQYGHGDVFIGLTIPQIRALLKEFKDLAPADVTQLLESEIHEERAFALLHWANLCKKASPQDHSAIVELYLKHLDRVNNWDLVDLSAREVLGSWMLRTGKTDLFGKLIKSKNQWHRRMAIVCTYPFIREKQPQWTFTLSERLLDDPEDLLQKAYGWMLREVGKHCGHALLLQFLDKHVENMSSIALSYATEHFDADLRKHYQRRRRPKKAVLLQN